MSHTEGVPPRRIGISDLEKRLGLSRQAITNWYKKGTFPPPHFLGEHRRWWLHEVEAWEREHTAPDRPRKRTTRG